MEVDISGLIAAAAQRANIDPEGLTDASVGEFPHPTPHQYNSQGARTAQSPTFHTRDGNIGSALRYGAGDDGAMDEIIEGCEDEPHMTAFILAVVEVLREQPDITAVALDASRLTTLHEVLSTH